MFRKPTSREALKTPEPQGFKIKLGHPEKGWLEINISESLAVKWTPWLAGTLSAIFGLIVVAGVLSLFIYSPPRQTSRVLPETETHQQK
ncbi:hypothetical protein ACN4EG_26995 [Alkalinema pantanalense CENA528]|uniref:hypothetical protein n=1 Tax=Alkalinema pantanalense TaxID=1620705 RepID=UPI003D6E8989